MTSKRKCEADSDATNNTDRSQSDRNITAPSISTSTSTFDVSQHFPPRRRAQQACGTCRQRKIRCDAGKPKCGLCIDLDVECAYIEFQGPKIDPNTAVLLDRIQALEDRLLSSSIFKSTVAGGFGQTQQSQKQHAPPSQEMGYSMSPTDAPAHSLTSPRETIGTFSDHYVPERNGTSPKEDGNLLIMPVSHTATANHVYSWPSVQAILESTIPQYQNEEASNIQEATDVFFLPKGVDNVESSTRPVSWRLLQEIGPDSTLSPDIDWEQALRLKSLGLEFEKLVENYFTEVNIFYNILEQDTIMTSLRTIIDLESHPPQVETVSYSTYCLISLVLCLSAFVCSGRSRIPSVPHTPRGNSPIDGSHGNGENGRSTAYYKELTDSLWSKASLLLGMLISKNDVEAVQCYILASIYLGARGQVLKSYQFIHLAAIRCKIVAKRASIREKQPRFSDSFCRAFWVVYVYENDFISEFSLTPPSGITQYEDIVPYPTFEKPMRWDEASPGPSWGSTSGEELAEFAAFQISTNSSIRKFLNRINAVIYDEREKSRKNHWTYANWLLEMSRELSSHHEALHQNLPACLLAERPQHLTENHTTNVYLMLNHTWNVIRLRGRYFAGQYVVHRSFVEYVIHNQAQLELHPSREDILEKCKACLDGCEGFVKLFSTEPANSITGLFATGMATFTMVIILIMAGTCPHLAKLQQHDTAHTIGLGIRNMERFGKVIEEFGWHVSVLKRLNHHTHGV